jgi:pyrimidine-nucleoside phosphorylase
MVWIAKLSERNAIALLSDMNQPLGCAVGNALEVKEAIQTLQGAGPVDFREHCLVVATHLLVLGGLAPQENAGRQMAEKALDDGRAWELFRTLVRAQGGDLSYVDEPDRLPAAQLIADMTAKKSAYLSEINARAVGESVVLLGGGRSKKGDPIDHSVGIVLHHKVGDWVEAGEPVCTIYANQEASLAEVRQRLEESLAYKDTPVDALPLFYDVVRWTDASERTDPSLPI